MFFVFLNSRNFIYKINTSVGALCYKPGGRGFDSSASRKHNLLYSLGNSSVAKHMYRSVFYVCILYIIGNFIYKKKGKATPVTVRGGP
jgi:hypothetical protein